MNKIVVTGGLGFIGSNLIDLLIKNGFFVLNIDKVSYSSNFYNTKDKINSQKIYTSPANCWTLSGGPPSFGSMNAKTKTVLLGCGVKNQKIIKVGRFSKYLILYLSNKSYCLLHLGISGTIHLVYNNEKNFLTNTSFYNSPQLPKKHNHIEIVFENFKLVYNDPRRFGFVQIIKNDTRRMRCKVNMLELT